MGIRSDPSFSPNIIKSNTLLTVAQLPKRPLIIVNKSSAHPLQIHYIFLMAYILNSLGSSLKLNDCNYVLSQKLMYFINIKAIIDLSRPKIDRWCLAPCTPECNFIWCN